MASDEELLNRAIDLLLSAEFGHVTQELVSAGQLLARHVRESLAGEAEAITEEWLLSIGFRIDDGVWISGESGKVYFCGDGWFDLTQNDDANCVTLKIVTRRQLLSLLSALGIEVKS